MRRVRGPDLIPGKMYIIKSNIIYNGNPRILWGKHTPEVRVMGSIFDRDEPNTYRFDVHTIRNNHHRARRNALNEHNDFLRAIPFSEDEGDEFYETDPTVARSIRKKVANKNLVKILKELNFPTGNANHPILENIVNYTTD